jgi:hypothetical protein
MALGLKRRAADVSPLVSATVKQGRQAHAHRSPESKPSTIGRQPGVRCLFPFREPRSGDINWICPSGAAASRLVACDPVGSAGSRPQLCAAAATAAETAQLQNAQARDPMRIENPRHRSDPSLALRAGSLVRSCWRADAVAAPTGTSRAKPPEIRTRPGFHASW